jgi:hypothetical protein
MFGLIHLAVSRIGNFHFWEIMTTGHRLLQYLHYHMPKSRHTARYGRLLQALRAAREEANLTQVQVAKHFGTYASFISKVEAGERRLDVVELADFCRLYAHKLTAFLKRAGIE